MTTRKPGRKFIVTTRRAIAVIGMLGVAQAATAGAPGERAKEANVEVLLGSTNKAFEGIEKLVELNLQVAKGVIGENDWAKENVDQMADYEPPGQVLFE